MGLSEEVEAEYKEAYACFAQDKQGEDKGYLTPEEYINALRMLGLNPSQKKAEEWKKEAGKQVKEDAFLKFMEKKRKEEPRESLEDLLECFRTFDKDGNGMIPLLELKHIYTTLNPNDEKFTDAEWAEVEKELDDGSGMVGYEEFAKLILGH